MLDDASRNADVGGVMDRLATAASAAVSAVAHAIDSVPSLSAVADQTPRATQSQGQFPPGPGRALLTTTMPLV